MTQGRGLDDFVTTSQMNKRVAAGAEPAGLGQPCQLIKCLGGAWHSGSAVSMLHVISPNHLYCRFLTIFFFNWFV